ncbi:hypothetical protein IU433_16510 [Nocardia puris]|uniref:Uncharacterized protein n=1 Tax=Nocardia puris TaxID=208602 RepID=A0A366DA05_9NOCA|nr:hypothetical protein [Nocardia puris]MBF6211717.1 hypothetical protein [Nocardia puris]MBF6365721.1 hypothetical protein [Nocardia puris]MBF6460637.1 hypothetical protein [Nocardia puris]RBO86891.1 hypothetical protein DFR74_11263 [Nocardia puris]
MLSKASSLWYVDAADPPAVLRAEHEPDPDAALALAKQLYADRDVVPIMVGTLGGCAGPDPDEVYIGCYPGVTVVCSAQAAIPKPTKLPEFLVRPLASEHTYLVSFDTAYGWGAFAHWERGELRRSFSSSRVNILEDVGLPLVWERSFWAGEHPVRWRAGELPDPQTLPFDPPDFADAANDEWIGFHYRAPAAEDALAPGDIAVCGFTLYPKGEAPDHASLIEPEVPEPEPARPRRGLFRWLRGHDRVS